MARLTKEEKEIMASYNRGEWKPVKNQAKEKKRFERYAREALRKEARVNIRLSTMDLEGIQRRAVEEGIPYQTLMASIIHKYVAGTLVPKS